MYKLNPETVFRKEFDGTAVLFDPDTGKTYLLNPTSRTIYDLLPHCSSEEEILAALGRAVKLPETAAADIAAFIADLRQNRFLLD